MAHNHLADIRSGRITRRNIIGIRKALSAAWRNARGYSNGMTAPKCSDASALVAAISVYEPTATGALTLSGLSVLRSKRWHKRFTDAERAIIDNLDVFRLVRFDDIGRGHFVPVWRAVDQHGNSFVFRNIPWQSALAYGLESGPTVEPE